jgi:hypothetical protein
MKALKYFSKRIVWINTMLVVFFLLAFQSCDDTLTSCTGCPSTSPYSKSGSSSCYATYSDCVAALGSGCVYCR